MTSPTTTVAAPPGSRRVRIQSRHRPPARVFGFGPAVATATADQRASSPARRASPFVVHPDPSAPPVEMPGLPEDPESFIDWDDIAGGNLPSLPDRIPAVTEQQCAAREVAAFDRGVASERQNLVLSTAVGAAISAVVGGGITWLLFRS